MDRPALQALLSDIRSAKIDIVVVYKVDRLTRSLADFAKMVEIFDEAGVSFVSVTQQFNTTSSMGRLTLNVLLSFAQFEREVTGERIRDKIAASKAKGMWMGGFVPLGYNAKGSNPRCQSRRSRNRSNDLRPLPNSWNRGQGQTRGRPAGPEDETARRRKRSVGWWAAVLPWPHLSDPVEQALYRRDPA